MGNGNKKIATFSYQKWVYTYTHTHPEFGEGGEEAASAEPGVPVLGLFHNPKSKIRRVSEISNIRRTSALAFLPPPKEIGPGIVYTTKRSFPSLLCVDLGENFLLFHCELVFFAGLELAFLRCVCL